MTHARFIEQARSDYIGVPSRIAHCTDNFGEHHVIIENSLPNGGKIYLDWIGAEFASEPDEFGDEMPFKNLRWRKIE
jgi:oxalate decarboxylase/phosphoglucose isomerase-like protein (cupin superfamily)